MFIRIPLPTSDTPSEPERQPSHAMWHRRLQSHATWYKRQVALAGRATDAAGNRTTARSGRLSIPAPYIANPS